MTFPFLALAACSDTTLVPVDAVPSQIATGSTSLAVGTCEHISVEPAATGARSVCPTVESTWDMEVELEIADEMAAFTSPIVLGGTLYALTGRDELLRVTAGVADLLPLPEGTAGGLTSLGGAHVDGQDLLTFALSVDGSTEVSVARYAPSTGELLRSDTLPALDVGQEIVFSDLDRDGELDLVSPGGFVSLDLSSIVEFDHTVNSGASVYIDELDGEPRVMQSEGLWNADGTQAQLWSDGLDFQGAIVEHLGRLLAIYTQWIDWFARWADTGEELWRIGPGVYEGSYRAAYGDADGDGVMDVCLLVEDAPVVMNADGDVIASWPAHEHWTFGACAMADLDGDGADEVIEWSRDGLFVRSALDGSTLASATDVVWVGEPALAVGDVTGDGSVDIIVAGRRAEDLGTRNVLRVYGTGDWAPTQAVWNTEAYDPAVVTDDGGVIPRPLRPSWQTGMGFRSQPARGGAFPDLVPLVDDVCCDGDRVHVSLRAANLGNVDAEGVVAHLSRWADGAWVDVWSASVGTLAAGATDQGRIIDVDGTEALTLWLESDTRECTPTNDQIEITCP